MNHGYSAVYGDICLRPLARADIEDLRRWRNDPDCSRHLNKLAYITAIMQAEWFERYISDGDIFSWGIDLSADGRKQFVGSISLYRLREGIGELGKLLVSPQAKGQGIGTAAMKLLSAIGFEKLGFDSIDVYVSIRNLPSIKALLNAGFEIKKQVVNQDGETEYYLLLERGNHDGFNIVN